MRDRERECLLGSLWKKHTLWAVPRNKVPEQECTEKVLGINMYEHVHVLESTGQKEARRDWHCAV